MDALRRDDWHRTTEHVITSYSIHYTKLYEVEITEGLPSDFGYAIMADPNDPDTVFQIPEESSHMRATVGGKLRVYRSRDGGRRWQPLTDGLPQAHAYVTVLREAMDCDALQPCGVYFGTSGGHLFASRDAGEHWQLIANFRITSYNVCYTKLLRTCL